MGCYGLHCIPQRDNRVAMKTSIQEAPSVATKQQSFRIPVELWDRAEALAEVMNGLPEFQGHPVTGSRVLVMAMHAGMETLEDRHAPKKGRKR